MANFSININKKTSNVIIGEDVSKGDLLYLSFNNKWYKTTAGNKAKSTTELMMALSDGLKDEQIELLNYGYFQFDNPILTSGNKYYVSINNGKITDEVYDTNDYDYVIRYVGTAFTDKILLFNPDQTYISDNRTKINEVTISGTGGGSSMIFENDIVVALSNNKTLGKYLNGDIMPLTGMTFEEAIRDIATETINPSFVAPSYTLSSSITGLKEVGSVFDVDLTGTFNRGRINGKIVNGVWNASSKQDDRAGAPSEYKFDGSTNGLNNTKTIPNYKTVLGPNSFQSQVLYEEGPQPVNSTGDDFSTPLPPGSLTSNASWTGFYYRTAIAGNSEPTATDIRNNYTERRNNAGVINLPSGTTAKRFDVFVPQGSALTLAIDEDNLSLDITSEFVLQSSDFSGLDANGEVVMYKHYIRNIDNPYAESTILAITVT